MGDASLHSPSTDTRRLQQQQQQQHHHHHHHQQQQQQPRKPTHHRQRSSSFSDTLQERDDDETPNSKGTELIRTYSLQQGRENHVRSRLSFRNRMASAWNNMRYMGQVFSARFTPEHPVWILGEMYDEKAGGFLDNVHHDIKSRLFMTYRQGFPHLKGSKLCSDVGWGCMLRSGQMLMAEIMVIHLLGRDWRLPHRDPGGLQSDLHRGIIRLFDDLDSPQCPFSVHNMMARAEGTRPGDWMGPSTVARALCLCVNHSGAVLNPLRPLRAYLGVDGTIYKDELRATTKNGSEFVPVAIIVPLRLGLKSLNKIYIPALKELFTFKHCVGIMGGRPRHSVHFIGFQDMDLIALDPHWCRDVIDMGPVDFSTETFHSTSPRKVPLSNVDPSMAVGFYCETEAEVEQLYTFAQKSVDLAGGTPLFSVAESFNS